MATLAKDKERIFGHGDEEDYPVIADDTIYAGSAVGENGSGHARPLQAGDAFLGFAADVCDNAGGAAADKYVRTRKRGCVRLPISGIGVTANDRPAVYASDDDTFTLTAGSNSLIGYVSRFDVAGFAYVDFDATLVKAALQA